MTCASCVNTITKSLLKTNGVFKAEVNLASEKATIEYDENKTSLNVLQKNIQKFGYNFKLPSHTEPVSQIPSYLEKLKNDTHFIFPLSIFIFTSMIYDISSQYFSFLPPLPLPMFVFNFINFLIAFVTLFFFGGEYLTAIPRFMKTKLANMNTLIGLGTLTAFIYSSIIFFIPSLAVKYSLPETTYFDVVIVVIGFIKFGKYLEVNSKQKTGEAVKKLLELSSKTAFVEREGKEIEVEISAVVIGDIIIVKPGSKIPVDGEVVFGNTTVDESPITGESLPVDKVFGDKVTSGTVNINGFIKFKAEKVGDQTMLSQIIKMVENAQGSKAPIEKIVDKVSNIFVPTVLILSLLSFIFWLTLGNTSLAISSFVGILVIACPCALGLATPTAIIVGVGKGALNGILIKDASSLEKLHKVNTVVFDKTGTITNGKPQVSTIVPTDKINKTEIVSILASLEKHSSHPLALAIVNYSQTPALPVTHLKEIPGKGISGNIKKTTYFAGNIALLKEAKINFNQKEIETYTNKGMTPVFLFTKQNLLGIVYISDTIKNNALLALESLRSQKIKTIMLTGDDKNTANYIAKQLNVDEVIAGVLPTQKAKVISEITSRGNVVAMVGDGINDAPALAEAEVGIAMSTGTDIAIESASITLLGGDILKVSSAIKLSKQTMNTIHQNLFWAFFYNVLSIPVAAGVLYPLFGIILNPAIAGAAMAFSSVSVVTNSLRLKTLKL